MDSDTLPTFSARFSSDLARVLYVEPDVSGVVRPSETEMEIVEGVCRRIETATDEELHAMCYLLESRVLPLLSGESLLRVARVIETKASWMLENVPRLMQHKGRLKRASERAQVFSKTNLERLSRALKDEASRS